MGLIMLIKFNNMFIKPGEDKVFQFLQDDLSAANCQLSPLLLAKVSFIVVFVHCWLNEGNWSVALVNRCQPVWADCI